MGGLTDAVLLAVVEPYIALVALNRPEARNAVNCAVAHAIEAIVVRIEPDPEIRAGADLKEVSAGRSATLGTDRGGFAGFVRAHRTKLRIAAAQCHALAGGLQLPLSSDLAVATETATFGLPEVKHSLSPGQGECSALPRALSKANCAGKRPTGRSLALLRRHQERLRL